MKEKKVIITKEKNLVLFFLIKYRINVIWDIVILYCKTKIIFWQNTSYNYSLFNKEWINDWSSKFVLRVVLYDEQHFWLMSLWLL
jgi:hypothetical protein